MATLQKIRNKGGLLVAIVIGAALFAFIVGDALKSGGALFKSSQMEVAVIGDESVSIKDFQKKVKHNQNIAQMMSGQSALTSEQQEQVREQTWQQMVMEMVMGEEYSELGIDVSSEELFDLVQGENISPIIKQIFKEENGSVDKTKIIKTLKNLINAPEGTPGKAYWLNIESQIKSTRQIEKYNELIQRSLYTTNTRAKELLANSSKKVDFSYIVKKYSSVSDKDIKISSDEIKAYYNTHKYLFEQAESRAIQYVNIEINPSEEDNLEAKKYILDLSDEFKNTQENKEYVNLNSDIKFNPSYFKKGEIENSDLDNFLFSGKKGETFGPYEEDGLYSLVKINNVRMLADSVKARHILIVPINKNYKLAEKQADSIANLIRKGGSFEKYAKELSADKNSAVNGGDLGWFGPKQMDPTFSDACFFSKKNEIKVVLTQYGAHIIKVTDQSKKVKKVQLATISRKIEPSQKTFNKKYGTAVKFAQAITDEASFDKAIEDFKLTKRIGSNIKRNDKTLAGLENPRNLIKDVYSADEIGKLLNDKEENAIYELGDKFVVAMLTEINEKGISPIDKVSETITKELKRKEKANIISKELTASTKGSNSLLSVAQKENINVQEANGISFESFQIAGAGIEPRLIATAVNLEKNKISTPIKGNQGVYVIMVNNITKDVISENALSQLKQNRNGMLKYRTQYQAISALKEHANIEDKRYKFY